MWRTIFTREISEIFGDARTRFNVIIGPLIFTPLFLAAIGGVIRNQAAEAKREQINIGIVGLASAPGIASRLNTDGAVGFRFTPVESAAEAERRVRARELKAALDISPMANAAIDAGGTAELTIIMDAGNESSGQAAERLKVYVTERGDREIAKRLTARGVPASTIHPFEIKERALKGTSGAMLWLAAILPYMLSISAIMGGIVAASNTIAGEKERGTLETLLVTAVSRTDIAIGKFAAVTVTAIVSSTLSLVGMIWPFYVHLSMFAWLSAEHLTFKPAAIAALLLVQIPLALFGSGLLLALSTVARNQKEMQTYAVPVVLLGTVASMLALLLKADVKLYWALVPITNAALVLKQEMQGIVNIPFIAIACGTSFLYAALAVMLAAHMFHRESILLRT